MGVVERIKLVLRWLIGQGVADSQEEIGKLLGYKNKSSFSQVVNGRVELPKDFIERLCSLSPKLNKVWIETGAESMFLEDHIVGRDNNSRNIHNTGSVSGPMITGDSNTILAEKDQQIQLLENEVKYLKEIISEKEIIISEKERFIQALLNK